MVDTEMLYQNMTCLFLKWWVTAYQTLTQNINLVNSPNNNGFVALGQSWRVQPAGRVRLPIPDTGYHHYLVVQDDPIAFVIFDIFLGPGNYIVTLYDMIIGPDLMSTGRKKNHHF